MWYWIWVSEILLDNNFSEVYFDLVGPVVDTVVPSHSLFIAPHHSIASISEMPCLGHTHFFLWNHVPFGFWGGVFESNEWRDVYRDGTHEFWDPKRTSPNVQELRPDYCPGIMQLSFHI